MAKDKSYKVSKFETDILDHFDFLRVLTVMECLDWTWGNGSIPTTTEMREMCIDLFKTALKWMKKDKSDRSEVSSGGFTVIVYKDGSMELSFVVTETDNYND